MNAIKPILSFIFLVTIGLTVVAQDKSPEEVKSMVTSQNFIFIPERVNPMTGSSRPLSPGFELSVFPDTVISYLPYFGRAYAPVYPGEGGVQFTSTDFQYKTTKSGDKWKIRLRFKDASDVNQMLLDVFDNGTATLSINSNRRQSITYYGYVKEGKPVSLKAF